MDGEEEAGETTEKSGHMRQGKQRALNWHDNLRKTRGLLVLSAVLVAGPAAAATLMDGAARTVDVPSGVTSVVPAGPPAQVLLQALAPSLLAGLVEPFKPSHAIYVDAKIGALPKIPMLSRSDASDDIAVVAALKPGLCIDYGRLSPRFVAATEKIEQELHVPAAILSGDLTESGSVATALGNALGLAARATDVASAVQDVLDRTKPLAVLPDAARVSVYMARGADGLQAMRAGTSFDEPVRLAGGRNVVVGGGSPFKNLSVADVVALKPSVVVFGEPEAFTSPLHDALPKGTTFVLDAGEPYKVLVGPPSLNRIIGLAALAPILHPDKLKADDDVTERLEILLFAIPSGVAVPAPLQVKVP